MVKRRNSLMTALALVATGVVWSHVLMTPSALAQPGSGSRPVLASPGRSETTPAHMTAAEQLDFLRSNPDVALARTSDPNTLRLLRLYRNWQLANACAAFLDNSGARLEARREIWEAERRVTGVVRKGCWNKAELLAQQPSAENCAIAFQFMEQMAEKHRSARLDENQTPALPALR